MTAPSRVLPWFQCLRSCRGPACSPHSQAPILTHCSLTAPVEHRLAKGPLRTPLPTSHSTNSRPPECVSHQIYQPYDQKKWGARGDLKGNEESRWALNRGPGLGSILERSLCRVQRGSREGKTGGWRTPRSQDMELNQEDGREETHVRYAGGGGTRRCWDKHTLRTTWRCWAWATR